MASSAGSRPRLGPMREWQRGRSAVTSAEKTTARGGLPPRTSVDVLPYLTARESDLVEVVPEEMGGVRPPQLGQGLGLDLTDSLAGHPEGLAHLFERTDLAVVHPEA